LLEIVPFRSIFASDCAAILAGVPEWFGRPEANAGYLANLALLPSWVAVADDEVVGAITLERHLPSSYEVHFMVVKRSRHRRGIGRALVAHVESEAKRNGGRWLLVKTLGPSEPDANYARTRLFYEAMGFSPLFESDAFWGAGTPALLLVKSLE